MPYSISLLLEKIETLYKTALALTQESEEETDRDRQIAIEEIRKETLEKADFIFEEIARSISIEKEAQEPVGLNLFATASVEGALLTPVIHEQDFFNQKERLFQLICQIRAIDKKRAILIEEERSELLSALEYTRLGKQAMIQYQKAIPIET
ncbi:MAG: hypothetical protein HY037_01495 [Nitrospirae bacterium]|nr:hypothetical protein [Candidatus Troglogloeales bacterium]